MSHVQRWIECNAYKHTNDWRADGKAGARCSVVVTCMDTRVDRLQGELTFCSASSSSLLIFRSSSNILHGDKGTRVIAAMASCLLALGRIWQVVICNSLWWSFLENGLITQRKTAPVHVGEWGSGQWKWSTSPLQNLPDVQLLELGEESQIVFSPGNFLSDNCWPAAKNSLETKRTCSAEISLSVGIVHRHFGGILIRKRTCLLPCFLC